MVTNYVSLTINETYDINTLKDKMAVIGIRTPSPGLVNKYIDTRQFKKVKFNSCSIRLASASQLPVDPLGVGFEAGQIAPQDIMNPLLFKAVSGESFSAVLDCIYNGRDVAANPDFYYEGSLDINHVSESTDVDPGSGDPTASDFTASAYDIYYTLLHDGTFRPAHPQQGLVVNNLVPLVRDIHSSMPMASYLGSTQSKWLPAAYSFGNDNIRSANPNPLSETDGVGYVWTDIDTRNAAYNSFNFIMSGKTRPMPAFNTQVALGMDNPCAWPYTYVGCLVVPPYKMASLYMRMVVSWHVTLSEFIPIFKRGSRGDTDPNWLYCDMIQIPVSPEAAAVSEGLEVKTDLLEGTEVDGINYIGSSMT